MHHSENINEIFGALAKAQGAYEATTKDRENPHFQSSYATLASGLNAARKALSANGIGYVQSVQTEENGVNVETMLGHASGQWIACSTFVPAAKFDAQGIGSASTYARRYAIFAMLGLAPEDDDGEDASRAMEGRNEQPPEREPRPKPRAANDAPREAFKMPYGKFKGKLISDTAIPVREIEYMIGAMEKSIADPSKRSYVDSNRRLHGALCAELDIRTKVPADNSDGNPDWGMGDADEAEAEAMAAAND